MPERPCGSKTLTVPFAWRARIVVLRLSDRVDVAMRGPAQSMIAAISIRYPFPCRGGPSRTMESSADTYTF